MTQDNNSLEALIRQGRIQIGNEIKDANGNTVVGSASGGGPVYVDANGRFAAGAMPIAMLFNANATSNSVLSIEGQSTTTANDLMHQTLVVGANATATIAGYYRVTVTDDAGNITVGAYYAPFYTLN